MEAQSFITKNIYLAVHLQMHNVRLLDVKALDNWRAEFIFEKPDSKLLNDWLENDNCKNEIDTYRHLVRRARQTAKSFIAQ